MPRNTAVVIHDDVTPWRVVTGSNLSLDLLPLFLLNPYFPPVMIADVNEKALFIDSQGAMDPDAEVHTSTLYTR